MQFIPEIGEIPKEVPAYWFLFNESNMLVLEKPTGYAVPYLDDQALLNLNIQSAELLRLQYLGRLNGIPCCCGVWPLVTTPPGWSFVGLRQLFGGLEENLYAVAGRARQISDWDRTNRYCGQCGSPTYTSSHERAKVCPKCGLHFFPQVSPAIIVAIVREDKILLSRSTHRARDIYSVLAGFVEPGETLEECLAREVMEEVGITVKNITYFASQPWPFPHNLMVAFTAEYAQGEIRVDGEEIIEADWFKADELPKIPGKISIARRLIEWFCEKDK